MKKLFILLEDVWVKWAFAEAGVYEPEGSWRTGSHTNKLSISMQPELPGQRGGSDVRL